MVGKGFQLCMLKTEYVQLGKMEHALYIASL